MPSEWSSLTFVCGSIAVLACTPTRLHHELDSPSYWWTTTQGVCGHTVVADVAGDVWTERSCETGPTHLSRVNSLSDAQHEAIRRAFAALPTVGKPADGKQCTTTQHTLRQREPGREHDVIWILCVSGGDEWDPKPIPEPYRRAVELLEAARHD